MATDWIPASQNANSPRSLALQSFACLSDFMEVLAEALNEEPPTLTCTRCKVSIPSREARPGQRCLFCGSPSTTLSRTDANRTQRMNIELPHISPDHSSHRFGSFTSFVNGGFGLLGNLFLESSLGRRFQNTPIPLSNNTHYIRRRRESNENYLLDPATDADDTQNINTKRLGSGSSLPPIRHQDVNSRRSSFASLSRAASRSEENITGTSESGSSHDPHYQELSIQRHDFLKEVKKAKKSKNYTDIKKFYFVTFESYANICATFKKDPQFDGADADDPGLRTELVHSIHDALKELPSLVHKHFLKGVINSLLEEKPHLFKKDRVRALFIILQCPVFLSQSSYNILAHVLRTITQLPNGDHKLLVSWCKTLEVSRFRLVISFITQFITVRQFPPPDRSLPPPSTSKWWIPTATRVLAIFYASNTSSKPSLVHYTEFYNRALDHVDLMQEYRRWQNPDHPDTFSYCQYPFVLSIVAKRFILTKDAEQQMILSARRSLVQRVAMRQPPQIDIFFLNIHVRRNHLVEDSLKEIAAKKSDLKKKLKVTFEGEPGLDMGGLTKEWFLLLIKQVFRPENQMVVYHESTRLHWFSMSGKGSLKEFNLIGVLMGLAVYNAIILDVRFPSICFKKLLSPPVVPSYEHIPVGTIKDASLEDLAEIMPEVARGLKELLKYEGNVEEDMCLSFQVSLDEYGDPKTFNLKEEGDQIPVTNDNRDEFVRLYLDWIINTAIYEQFRAFYLGFHTVTASNALITLRSEEVEMLVCGSPIIDLRELRKVTEYDGYERNDPQIHWFWEILNEMSVEQQKQFLLFTTGSDRIPVGGMAEMPFKISCWRGQTHMLPQAHTCFNQLVLPPYDAKEIMKSKIIIAIHNAEGFGLE